MTLTLDAERPAPARASRQPGAVRVRWGADGDGQPLAARWLAETLDILAAEGRASRAQHHHVFGGFRADDGAVILYAGAQEDLVAVQLTGEAFEQLRSTMSAPR